MRITLVLIILVISISANADVFDDPCMFINEKDTPCVHELDGNKFIIFPNGNIEFSSVNINVLLPQFYEIEWLIDTVSLNNSVYFSIGITDGDYAGTIIISISITNKALNWQTNIPGFNGSPMLIYEGAIYTGAIGSVTRLNALNGSKEWEHTGLYERKTGAYNSFNLPFVEGNNIIFPENKVPTAKYDGIKRVIVNIETGELISK